MWFTCQAHQSEMISCKSSLKFYIYKFNRPREWKSEEWSLTLTGRMQKSENEIVPQPHLSWNLIHVDISLFLLELLTGRLVIYCETQEPRWLMLTDLKCLSRGGCSAPKAIWIRRQSIMANLSVQRIILKVSYVRIFLNLWLCLGLVATGSKELGGFP